MADQSFLTYVLDVYQRAREARVPHEAVWDKCTRAYRGQYDFSGRQKWQSRCVLPKIARDVDFVAQSIGSAIGDDQQETFALKGGSEVGDLAAPIMADVIQANLDRENFSDNMRGLLTYGQLTPGVVAKVSEVPGPWPGYVTVSPVPYRRWFVEASGGPARLCVTPFERAEVQRLCEANGWDASLLEGLSESGDSDAAEDERKWLQGCAGAIGWQASPDELKRTVFLLEYWGPAYDVDGNQTSEWTYGVIANKAAVLAQEDLPFGETNGRPRKMSDVVAGSLMSDPFALYAKPYALDAVPVAEAQQEVINLVIDQSKLQVNAIGLNYDAIEAAGGDGAQAITTVMAEGVAAGKPIPFRGPNPPLVPLTLANLNPGLLNVLALLDQERQASTGATDMARGLAATEDTSSQTLGEFQSKQATSGQSLAALGKGLEKRFIEPLVENILWHYRNAGFSIMPQPQAPLELDEFGQPTPESQAAMQAADAQIQAIRNVAGRKIEAAVDEMLARGLVSDEYQVFAEQMLNNWIAFGALPPDEVVQAVLDEGKRRDGLPALQKLDEALRDEFQVRAAGVSAVLERAEAQGKLERFISQVVAIGGQVGIDKNRAIRTMARLANLDLNDVMKDDFELVIQQEEQMQAQMALAEATAPPPQGVGEDAPPEGEGGPQGPPQDGGMPPEGF